MAISLIWSDYRLKDLSIESKNVRIGVRTREIWSCKVGGLKMCMSSRGHVMAPLPHYNVRAPCNCAKLAHNSVPESIMEQLQSTQLHQTYAIAWMPIRSPNFSHFRAPIGGEVTNGIKGA